MIAHRSDPLEILRKARPAYLHLDRAESLFEIIVGLMQQLIQRKIEINATSVSRHPRVMTAEQPPKRCPEPSRLQVPKRNIHRRNRQARRPAPAAIVQGPPHALPQRLNPVRLG